jgi:hypothetical protein
MSQLFAGKIYVEPGSGVQIVTNATASPNLLASGVVGVIGESTGGLTAADSTLYSSDDPGFFKSKLIGGVAKKCIDYIFNPSPDLRGANRVIFCRAQAATAASNTDIGNASPVVTLTLTTKDKGAYLSDATNGIGYKLVVGVLDSAKHIFMLYKDASVVFTSAEISTFAELKAAIEADAIAASLITAVITGTASTAIANSERQSSLTIFAGGTSPAMTGTDIDNALLLFRTQNINILYIASETAVNYLKGLAFATTTAEFPILCFMGGEADETVAEVEARSLALNSEKAVLCTPGIIMENDEGSGTETLSPMYFAAICAGLTAGLNPENPLTWKKVKVLGFEKEYTKAEREELITKGVLVGRNVPGIGFAVNKGVNTLQNNGSMIIKITGTNEATSPEISIIRIKQQMIRELIVNSAPLFVGGNIATVTREDIVNFVKAYLSSRTSTNTVSNLLVNWDNVVATLNTDAWYVGFNFTPNGPINHVFFTGTMLRPTA